VKRFRVLAALTVLAFAFASCPRPAAASVELKLVYWPTNTTYTSPTISGTWTTNFIGGDFRWTSDESHWGIHLKYDTGSETNIGGFFTGLFSGGTDAIWSADVFYAWQFPALTVRAFAGYGDIKNTLNFAFGGGSLVYDATGYRVGADAMIPVPNTNFAFNASAAWYPSTSTSLTFTSSGFTRPSSGSATDLSASVQYTWPTGVLVEGGYRWINNHLGQLALVFVGTGETTSGPFFSVGYRW
jgi:hypothetical protein